jgi:hypothetical protein
MDLKLALEDLLSVPVDLVTRRGLRAELRQRIEDEAIPLGLGNPGPWHEHLLQESGGSF